MATQVAAPTVMAATMAGPVLIPPNIWVIIISKVTAIKVMPDNGDQLVRPMASDKIIPAIQIHKVPSTAIKTPRAKPTSWAEVTAITPNNMAAPTTAKYNNLMGISSLLKAMSSLPDDCMDLIADL